MELFNVDLITDLDEQVCVLIHANDQSEAEAIAVSMLENDELPDFITFIRHHIAQNENQRVT